MRSHRDTSGRCGGDHRRRHGRLRRAARSGQDPEIRFSRSRRIADEKERSLALFQEAGKVITHARCVNCHPAGDRPAQGDDRHPHMPLVVRGVDNFGAVGMRCTTCHGPANFDPAGIPGHPEWHVAPIEMAWVGKSLGEICQQIKDPERNGGKSMEELDRITWPRIRSSAGAGTPASAASRRRARRRSSAR